MKNSIKLLVLAAVCVAAFSCDSKPSTMSYTLAGTFGYVTEQSETFKVVDSLYYNKYIMLDNYSALCTSCEDMNTGFNGGWKVSLKKGSLSEADNLQVWASSGVNAGFTDTKSGAANKAYAVYSPSTQQYDIVFKYGDYFSKSTCYLSGFYINNTKYVEKLAAEGGIADGDFLKVTATLFKNGSEVGSEEFYLVDYGGAEKKIVKDWTAWEFKSGVAFDVDAVKFSVTSGSGNLPQNFCLDVFIASVSVEY